MLITVEGNLNTKLWTDMKNFSPLNGSLNLSDYTNNIQKIKQYHLIGKNDNIVLKEILYSYLKNFSNKSNISYKILDSTHSCCWEKPFKILLQEIK